MTEPLTDGELAELRCKSWASSVAGRLIARIDLEGNRADHEHLRADIQMHGAIAARAEAESLAGLVERTEEKLDAAEAEVERLRPLVEAVVVWDIADDEFGKGGNTHPAVALDGVKAALAALAAPPDPKAKK